MIRPFVRALRQRLRARVTGSQASADEYLAAEVLRRRLVEACIPPGAETLIDFASLMALADGRRREYQAAEPFPHVVIDDFLSGEVFQSVFEALPRLEDPELTWGKFDAYLADGRPSQFRKAHLENVLLMKPPVRQLIWELSSGPFLLVLARLSGIDWLLPDPHLQGGGVHIVEPEGRLRLHADFRKHPAFHVERRLNLLLFMNVDWKEQYGGHLELWNKDMSRCVQKIAPIANRCVIFSTGSESFHGHPHPLRCPPGVYRKSIALYYYTVMDAGDAADTSRYATLWRELPSERARE